jgi:hypothetical protein
MAKSVRTSLARLLVYCIGESTDRHAAFPHHDGVQERSVGDAHQRLEFEADLIAAHVLALGRVPPAQFFG